MIIGRKEEIAQLKRAYESDHSEFVAVYGRRRIGKTYLIRKTFKNEFLFQYTGGYKITNKKQLEEFHNSLISQGLDPNSPIPKDWFDAFHLLENLVAGATQKRKVIFIDELPWMDARNSRFVQAFEHFWNSWASARQDILLIICGSATSWIINKIFRNKGGLYNRVTYKMYLKQFSLHECEELVTAFHLPYNRNMIMEGYMVMGGVPYYWTKLDSTKSIQSNINDLFISDYGELRDEYEYVYSSMFNKPDKYLKVIEALAGKKGGLTREEIVTKGDLENNGQLSNILDDLIRCGFVRKYCHTGKHQKDALYQLVDCYSLFYHQFVKKAYNADEQYWVRLMNTPTYTTWSGLAFERICLLHTRQIKMALGISGIMANVYSWHVKKTEYHPGVQIDLLIDRSDNIINVCEMKYAPDGLRISTSLLANIKTKLNVLREYMPARKFIAAVLVTSNGVIRNMNSDEINWKVNAVESLFQP